MKAPFPPRNASAIVGVVGGFDIRLSSGREFERECQIPNSARILYLLVSFDSSLRKGACRNG